MLNLSGEHSTRPCATNGTTVMESAFYGNAVLETVACSPSVHTGINDIIYSNSQFIAITDGIWTNALAAVFQLEPSVTRCYQGPATPVARPNAVISGRNHGKFRIGDP